MSSVDVIVPCYRYGHYLRQCVESVLSQEIPNIRVMIIDDASPDETADVGTELAREDSRVSFSRHSTNKGHIKTYNEGIEWVSADYMLLLSADDYLLPGALNRAANLMDTHPEVGFTFGKVIELSDNGTTRKVTTAANTLNGVAPRIFAGPKFIELSGARNIVPTPTAVVRAELQKQLGGYRPQLPHSGDMEMWLRLAAHAPVGVIEAYQAVYRCHSDRMSLGYFQEKWLPDFRQRKAALDCFIQTCDYTLENAKQLYRSMLWELGCEAIGSASAAFNDAEMELSDQLYQFALSVHPDVHRSWPSIKLACKRNMGCKTWRELQPAVAGIRQWLSPLMRLAKHS